MFFVFFVFRVFSRHFGFVVDGENWGENANVGGGGGRGRKNNSSEMRRLISRNGSSVSVIVDVN